MRIAFVNSAYKTIFFHHLARLLEAAGHEVFWLSATRRWPRWQVANGIAAERILDLTRWGREWTAGGGPTAAELLELRVLEEAGDVSLYNLILMDPLLPGKPADYALKYLAVCQRHLREFLESRRIGAVFGEMTWAVEILTGQVCRALGIPYLVPHTVRIPGNRFTFFDGHLDTNIFELRGVVDDDRRAARRHLEEFRDRRPQPFYMALDRRILRLRRERLRFLGRHLLGLAGDRYDETSRRPLGLIRNHLGQLLRQRRNRRLKDFRRPVLPPARPYVYFPLQVQPESSIDVKGTPFCNQVELVRTMARTLPVSHHLYVKEHSIALPQRPRGFYRELVAIPGARLIDARASTFEVMLHADLVVAVTSTAAYEASLLGRPAATMAPIFFERIVRFPRFNPFHDSLTRLLAEARSAPPGDKERVEFLAWVLAQSFPGTVGDPFWIPGSMARDNVEAVAAGFLELLRQDIPRITARST